MTKKTYIVVAKVLQNSYKMAGDSPSSYKIVEYIAGQLVDMFAQDNPRFDRERFSRACRGEK